MHDDEPQTWTIEFLPANPPPSKIYKGFWVGLIVLFIISAIMFSL